MCILWVVFALLNEIAPTWVSILPFAAFTFFLSGLSLCLLQTPGSFSSFIIGRLLAASVFVLGVLGMLDLTIESSLLDFFTSYLEPATSSLRIPPITIFTSFNFMIFGVSLFFLHTTNRSALKALQIGVFTSATLSLIMIYGHTFNIIGKFEFIYTLNPPAYLTNIMSCTLACGIYFSRPKEGFASLFLNNTLGGITARKLVLIPLSVPFLIGFIRVLLEKYTYSPPELIYALSIFINMLILTLLSFWWVNRLWELDLQRRKTLNEEIVLTQKLLNLNQDLEDFAFVVSHDLKAPLRGIASLAEWLKDDYADKIDDEGKKKLSMLISRTNQMNNLITGILEYSRIGRIQEPSEAIDLNLFIKEMLENLQIPSNITIAIDPDLPAVTYPPIQLREVFQNLIGNAIKFMDKEKGLIQVKHTTVGPYMQFSIIDNGPGIDPKFFGNLFKLFQPLNRAKTSESTGIGLSIVKKIVEQWGGKVWFESEVGKGTTFHFTIPKSKP